MKATRIKPTLPLPGEDAPPPEDRLALGRERLAEALAHFKYQPSIFDRWSDRTRAGRIKCGFLRKRSKHDNESAKRDDVFRYMSRTINGVKMSSVEIAQACGGCSHASVLRACKQRET